MRWSSAHASAVSCAIRWEPTDNQAVVCQLVVGELKSLATSELLLVTAERHSLTLLTGRPDNAQRDIIRPSHRFDNVQAEESAKVSEVVDRHDGIGMWPVYFWPMLASSRCPPESPLTPENKADDNQTARDDEAENGTRGPW